MPGLSAHNPGNSTRSFLSAIPSSEMTGNQCIRLLPSIYIRCGPMSVSERILKLILISRNGYHVKANEIII